MEKYYANYHINYLRKYGYDPSFQLSPFPTLIQFTYLLGGIQNYVIYVGKWIFDINITFALPLTYDYLY